MSDILVYLALSQLFFIRWSEFDSGSGYNLVVLGAWEVRSREKGPNENGRPKAKATSTAHYVVVPVAVSTVEVVLLQSRIVHENFAMAKVLLEATTGQPTLGCIRPRIELANFILYSLDLKLLWLPNIFCILSWCLY